MDHLMEAPLRALATAEIPIEVDFHTVDGVFIKQVVVPRKQTVVPQHAHVWAHTTMLARGSMYVSCGKEMKHYTAPQAILIPAGMMHSFVTMEDDTVFYCIHNLHDAEKVAVLAEHHLEGVA